MHWLAIDFRSIGRWSMDWLVDGSCVWLVCGLVVDILKLANCRVATQPAITTAICARIFASPASTFLFLFQADFLNYRCPLVQSRIPHQNIHSSRGPQAWKRPAACNAQLSDGQHFARGGVEFGAAAGGGLRPGWDGMGWVQGMSLACGDRSVGYRWPIEIDGLPIK